MLKCYVTDANANSVPIVLVSPNGYESWLSGQDALTREWLASINFIAKAGNTAIIPDAAGKLVRVVSCSADLNSLWSVGHLPMLLPSGIYHIEDQKLPLMDYAIAWGLGAYQFSRYKKPERDPALLKINHRDAASVTAIVESIYLVRDWTNTPAEDMGPSEFAAAAESLAKQYRAAYKQIVGDDLLKHQYGAIHTVGRASDDAPRLIDIRWGDVNHPRLTLVGKGVCFDSGGLDIKPSAYMLLMKKDMSGGAHVMGLARMIMEAKLPVNLRVLVPAVENVISGNAFRPGDVIVSRSGKTIEIGNTDAEGRLVLADALTEAVSDSPDLIIDISTLTGAARIALGADLPAVFSNNDDVVSELIKEGERQYDPMWRLPLFAMYREHLNSQIADINNNSSEPYGGAISAALFLKEFVPDTIPWLHFDLMAWNTRTRPGRPQGGEAFALRALFGYLKKRYGG